MARPTKYEPEYNDFALDYVGIQDKSIVQLARQLQVSRQTIYQWCEDYPEFSDTLSCARDWSEAFWEDYTQENMTNRDLNAPVFKLYMANRFKWSDKPVEDEGEKGEPMNVTFTVSDPVKSIKVTKGQKKAG